MRNTARESNKKKSNAKMKKKSKKRTWRAAYGYLSANCAKLTKAQMSGDLPSCVCKQRGRVSAKNAQVNEQEACANSTNHSKRATNYCYHHDIDLQRNN